MTIVDEMIELFNVSTPLTVTSVFLRFVSKNIKKIVTLLTLLTL